MSEPDPLSTATSPIGIPDSLTVRSEAAAAVGSVLLGAGMASYRVKWAMSRTARALGLDSFTSIVTYTDITATATMGGRYRTRVTQPPQVGVNVDRIYRTQRFVETLPASGISASEVFERLDQITSRTRLYPRWMNAVSAGIACSAFAFLNQSGPVDMLVVLIAAALGQFARLGLLARGWNHLLVAIIAAVVSAVAYLAAILIPQALGLLGDGHLNGYMAAVLFLVPGFPLITGLLDLVRSDFAAGLHRLAYATMIILGAAASLWAVGLAAGIDTTTPSALGLPFSVDLALRAAATFIGVLGFAVLFNSPIKIAVAAAGLSMVANSLRFVLTGVHVPIQLATFAATVLIGVGAYVIARTAHFPRTAMSVPAVVIMIPGYTLYSSFTVLNSGNMVMSLFLMQEALQIVVAAAFGLALAHLATSPDWRRVEHPH